MRIALISDVHGNLVSMNAVLADIDRQGIDLLISLGDVAASGPRPVECLKTLRRRKCLAVMGNTDERFIGGGQGRGKAGGKEVHMLEKMDEWAASQLSKEDTDFIRTFLPVLTVEMPGGRRMLCYHGSPRSNRELLSPSTAHEKLIQLFPPDQGYELYAGGHSHKQMYIRFGRSAIMNPGSVGLPFESLPDGRHVNVPRGEYAIIDASEGTLSVQLLAVKVDRERIVEDALASGMPHAEVWAADWHHG